MSQIQLNESLFQIRNLSVSFSKMRGLVRRERVIINAVNNVSFGIRNAEVLSIVGESGSGKTTIAKCLLKLIEPVSGTILYNDKDIRLLKGKDLLDYRREVQLIYQDPYESLDPGQNVFSIVSGPIRYLLRENNRSQIHDMVSSLLEEVGLNPEKYLYRFPHQLSGGERQRVNIARALASGPKVLVADEPITMLDAAQRSNILTLLARLKQRRHLTLLLITHDLPTVRVMRGRTMVMYLGNLVEAGDTQNVITSPHHPYVELIDQSTPVVGRYDQYDGDEDSVAIESEEIRKEGGCIFRPRCRYATQICTQLEPPIETKSSNHFAACHNAVNLPTTIKSEN